MHASLDILGTRVDDVTYAESRAILQQAIADRTPTRVATPNPEIVMAARRDPAYRAVLNRTELNIPDGIGLLIAARWRKTPLREHVQGTDLVLQLAALSPEAGYRWFLLGGHGDVAQRAADVLRARYPGLHVAGADPGSPFEHDDHHTRALLQAAGRIDVLLVAYGAPKQELWLDRNLHALRIPVGIGVGGVFNYIAGDAPRAPKWVRDIKLEWLHRLVTQPSRWRRQLALPQFAALALLHALRTRRRTPSDT